ncbi:Flavocytochrome yedZ [Kluyvera cryocrescens]|uniref:Flavocytochrome yedZ n=1 Tax=Kluyvera cryocrescens TaxID=580 RepID=A0A485AFB0_KLUCR|nr:Flavocytochrome yedZ [Kluyvera cryocrescens]
MLCVGDNPPPPATVLLELGIQNLSLLGQEIVTRPYLLLGFACWLILLALAVTSTQAMQRKLGRRWQLLHNFVYLVAILAPIHFLWSVKIISPQPVDLRRVRNRTVSVPI